MGGLCTIVFQNSIQYKYLNMIIKTYYQNYWKMLITYYTVMNSNAMTVGGEERMSRPWSYGSLIYNYLCNQCQPPPTDVCEFESQSGRGVYHYVIKFASDLRQVGGFLRVLRFPPKKNWPQRYIWNIVESGVKQHQPNKHYLFG